MKICAKARIGSRLRVHGIERLRVVDTSKRAGQPEDIAWCCGYLASDEVVWIAGANTLPSMAQ